MTIRCENCGRHPSKANPIVFRNQRVLCQECENAATARHAATDTHAKVSA